jgi:hypothetical protein
MRAGSRVAGTEAGTSDGLGDDAGVVARMAEVVGPALDDRGGLDETGRERALDALPDTVTAHASSGGITFASGAWLIRAARPAGGAR